jgi:hypothetical protein
MNVTVVDAQGSVVRSLAQDAFTISEDGQPRSIAQFAAESAPLSLVVAVDASSSMQGRRFEFAREAVLKLLDRPALTTSCSCSGSSSACSTSSGTRDRDAIAHALADIHPNGPTALPTQCRPAFRRFATHRRQADRDFGRQRHMVDPWDDRRPVAAREASAIEIARRWKP